MRKLAKTISYYIVTLFTAMIFIVPLLMVMINSFKDKKTAAMFSISLPDEWHFENYLLVFEEGNVARAFTNGLILSVSSVIIIIIVSALAAFVIARTSSKWGNIMYYIFLCGLIVPVAFIPTYLVLNKLHLINTYLGLILVSATYGIPMSIFLFVGFIKSVPRELDEAAIIDGCAPVRMLFRIIVPLLKPVTVTTIIFNFVGSWNGIQVPLYFANSDKWGLPLTVYNFYGAHSSSWNLIFADIIITVAPLLVIYILMQKYIISGMTAGAVKS